MPSDGSSGGVLSLAVLVLAIAVPFAVAQVRRLPSRPAFFSLLASSAAYLLSLPPLLVGALSAAAFAAGLLVASPAFIVRIAARARLLFEDPPPPEPSDWVRARLPALPQDEAEEIARMAASSLGIAGLSVKDVMTPRPFVCAIPASSTIEEAVHAMGVRPHSRMPVLDDEENVVGVIDPKRLLTVLGEARGSLSEPSLLAISDEPYVVPETMSLLRLLKGFRSDHRRYTVAVDEFGAFSGVVTLKDVAQAVFGQLSDPGASLLSRQAGASSAKPLSLDGSTSISLLNRELGWDLPEQETATIGGLVARITGIVPPAGHAVQVGGYLLEVARSANNRVERVLVSRSA
jgi:magnesium and cobalt transporter